MPYTCLKDITNGKEVVSLSETDICDLLIELRKQTSMSQKAFAEYFNIPVSTLQDWEHHRRKPSVYLFQMMSRLLEYERKFNKLREDDTNGKIN